jgi:hypothetical protein
MSTSSPTQSSTKRTTSTSRGFISYRISQHNLNNRCLQLNSRPPPLLYRHRNNIIIILFLEVNAMNYNRALRYLLAGALAASAVEALAPSVVSLSAPSRRLPSSSSSRFYQAAPLDTDAGVYVQNPILDLNPLPEPPCADSLCLTEALDAEVDTFASPYDKRYSASDWRHNMVSLPNSGILREIKGPVGWITAWSTLVSIVYKLCNIGGYGQVAGKMCLGSTPHSLIASSIGLLLVFRTNSAYQQFRVCLVRSVQCSQLHYVISISHQLSSCYSLTRRRDEKLGSKYSTHAVISHECHQSMSARSDQRESRGSNDY